MQKAKILLYNPQAVFYTMPLGLLAVGSHLDSERFETIIVDGRLEPDPLRALKPHLSEALCLGMSVLTGRPIHDALQVARAVKAARPDLPIIWGGWHPSLFPKACLEEPSIDIAVQAQGEATFCEIVERLTEKQNLEGVAGCTFRRNGVAVQNPPRVMQDMNAFAPMNYDLIPVQKYYALKKQRQLDYISSTGCYFRCTFCADPFVYKRKWTALTPERMGEELEHLWRRHRFDDLHLQDETYFTYRDRVVAVAEEFLCRSLKFTWTATLRADQGVRLAEEDFALCKRSGLRRVLIGVESGSQDMLNWMKKDITIEQILLAAERCARHDIAVDFPMIVGFPDEPEESVLATLRIAKQLRAMSPKFKTQIFFYQPYPGSPISGMVKAKGYPLPQTLDEWADFDFVGSYGPWVSRAKWQLVQRFKFYSRHAWDTQKGWLRRPLQHLANWRCAKDFYHFPIEKWLTELVYPHPQIS
ncbi:B12-binding domain-containing radical SAM protein [candidate division KSB1 bacterium]|nr:B12-binding domain-containing radical SAM protein [candidate division KSB1 bacterium]